MLEKKSEQSTLKRCVTPLRRQYLQWLQAIPQMVMQGQDPMKIVEKMAAVIDERKKGTPLEDAVAKAFKPEPAPKQPAMQPGMPEVPASPEQAWWVAKHQNFHKVDQQCKNFLQV
jgi:hypothetical protein